MSFVPLLVAELLASLLGLGRGEPAQDRVTLAAVGDIQVSVTLRKPREIPGGDPFVFVRSMIADADLAVGNLEGVVRRGDRPAVRASHGPSLRQPPEVGTILAGGGFDLVSLANNHALDFGASAVADTLETLDAAGVAHAGAWIDPADRFQPVVRSVGGVTVAFVSYTLWLNLPGMADTVGLGMFCRDDAATEIAAIRPHADFVVVLAHWGRENDHYTYGATRDLAHTLVDAGADVVIGHHAHVLKGIERYRGALVAYSLGNFVFGFQDWPQAASAILRLTLVRKPDGARSIEEVRVVPVVLEGPRSVPIVAGGASAARVLRLLGGLSRPMGVTVGPDGSVGTVEAGDMTLLHPRLRGLVGGPEQTASRAGTSGAACRGGTPARSEELDI